MDSAEYRKLFSFFSLARRAGVLQTGEFCCERALSGRRARLIVVCFDASVRTKEKFRNKAEFYGVPFIELSCAKETLSAAAGQKNRAVAAICHGGFAEEILTLTKAEGTVGGGN